MVAGQEYAPEKKGGPYMVSLRESRSVDCCLWECWSGGVFGGGRGLVVGGGIGKSSDDGDDSHP